MPKFDENLKNEIKSYFDSVKLTPQQEKKIESLLKQGDFRENHWISWRKRFLLPALVAAAVFAFVNLAGIWNATHRGFYLNRGVVGISGNLTLTEQHPSYESRFFLFDETPDGGFQKKPRLSLSTEHDVFGFPLISVAKLNKTNEKGVLRKIKAATGKIHSIYAWRQNAYADGYSVVQSNVFSEGLSLENPE